MAFRTITNLSCDTTITIGGFNKKLKKDNPTQIEGYYLGKKKVADAKKKSGFSYLYTLQTPKGNVGVWGRTDLDRQFRHVSAGSAVRISAAGTMAVPTGEMYLYKVEADDDNTIEVSAETGNEESSYSDEDSDQNAYSESSVESLDEEDNEDERPSTQALKTLTVFNKINSNAAERKAAVEAMVKAKQKPKT